MACKILDMITISLYNQMRHLQCHEKQAHAQMAIPDQVLLNKPILNSRLISYLKASLNSRKTDCSFNLKKYSFLTSEDK